MKFAARALVAEKHFRKLRFGAVDTFVIFLLPVIRATMTLFQRANITHTS